MQHVELLQDLEHLQNIELLQDVELLKDVELLQSDLAFLNGCSARFKVGLKDLSLVSLSNLSFEF